MKICYGSSCRSCNCQTVIIAFERMLTFYGRTLGQSGNHLGGGQSASFQHSALAASHFLLNQMVIAGDLDSTIGLFKNERMILQNESVAERAVSLRKKVEPFGKKSLGAVGSGPELLSSQVGCFITC